MGAHGRYAGPMSLARPLPRATLDELLALPADAPHELVAGALVPKEAASGRHGEAQLSVGIVLRRYRRGGGAGGPGGWLFAADALVTFEPDDAYRPDVAGWRREHLRELGLEVPIRVRPDWVCEILSTNRVNDLVKKKRVYHRHRVPHYWIIDPDVEMLTVYRWGPDGYIEVLAAQRGDHVRAEPFDETEIRVGVFFGDDEDEGP